MKHTEILDACVNAESAMFHVLADRGFNSRADRDAMEHALLGIRKVIKGINPEAVGELLEACRVAAKEIYHLMSELGDDPTKVGCYTMLTQAIAKAVE